MRVMRAVCVTETEEHAPAQIGFSPHDSFSDPCIRPWQRTDRSIARWQTRARFGFA